MSMGRVAIVGAGPGDPDLMTVKAMRYVKEADVVLYDSLFGDEIVSCFGAHTEAILVGKRAGDQQCQGSRQQYINQQMRDFARAGKFVVRLKTGDPLIFGRGIEEIHYLTTHNVPYEMVPGVTAGIAAANLKQIPITERSKNGSVLFCTGSTVNGDMEHMRAIAGMMREGTPLVIYMGSLKLAPLIAHLQTHGVPDSTHVCVVSLVSQPGECMISGNFTTIVEKLATTPPPRPAVVLMGEHAHSLLPTAS